MNTIKNRKGVSPVIATVILVAVAITIAVAVSYWMSGISGQYTKFEKVEIQSATCTKDAFDNWVVALTLKNAGSASATIASVFVNDVQATYSATAPVAAVATITNDGAGGANTTLITSGDSATVNVWIGHTYLTLSSGTAVNIKIHSAGGMDYYKLIELV